MRVFAVPDIGRGNAHRRETPDRLPFEFPPAHAAPVLADHLADLPAHGVHRVQRRHGILKDDGDILPAQSAHLPSVLFQLIQANLLSALLPIGDRTLLDARELRQQPQDSVGCDGLPAAGLADDAERPAAPDVEADAPKHLVAAAVGIKADVQILDAQHDVARSF